MKNNLFTVFIAAGLILGTVALISSSTDGVHPVEARPSTVKPFELPKDISIAGESLPLERLDVQESLDREILVNSYWQSNNLLMLKRSEKWFPVIEPILKKQGIPEDFKYLALIESGLQDIVSPAGAAGPWQIMKTTGREAGLIINSEVDERYHMEKATIAACQYLKEAYDKFGNWTLAAASYNMGMSGTQRRLEEQRVSSYYDLRLNNETARYVYRIAAVKHIHEHLDTYGYIYHSTEGYFLPDFDTVAVNESVESWIDWSLKQGITYKNLRMYNPWIRSSKLTNSSNNTYFILVAK
mgnify:CR=1 FL=1